MGEFPVVVTHRFLTERKTHMPQLAEPLHSLFVHHPDFHHGVNTGRAFFLDCEEEPEQIQNETWIIQQVTEELEPRGYRRSRRFMRATGAKPITYLQTIGFVLGQLETALLPSSDFWQGVEEGKKAYEEGLFFPEDNKIWRERDVIAHMVREIDARVYRRHVCFERATGKTPLTYLHLLGFSVGYVDRALAHSLAA
jgi:hypothetical protein